MNWILSLFRKTTKQVEIVKHPEPGSKWYFFPSDNPWPSKNFRPITVLDAKDGWVRYKMSDHLFNDERMELSSFLHCYRPVCPIDKEQS